jgi:tetratricopeptide (TPR) repeat protein
MSTEISQKSGLQDAAGEARLENGSEGPYNALMPAGGTGRPNSATTLRPGTTALTMRSSVTCQAITGRESPPKSRRHAFLAVAILAVTLLAYLPAMRGGFFWDDDIFLTHNKLIASPDGLRQFWLTTQAADYFPLTSSALWLEWRLWGNHAAGYHVVNVLLHAIAAVLLWRALLRLRIPGAWLAGLLFGVHPVAAASAAWITELKNTLAMVLYLLSLLAWLAYDERGGWRSYALALALFLLALLAKTSVVMLPLVLLLCAWWRHGEISRKDLVRSVPFFALSLVLGLATIWFQQHKSIGSGEVVQPEDMASRVAAAGWIVWFYLFKLLLPAGLCVIYPRWSVAGSSALVFLPLALLIAVAAWLWTNRKSWGRAPLFALAYFVVTLLPVLGWVDMAFMRFSLVADHLQYTAMIGVIALVSGVAASACSTLGPKGLAGKLAAAGCVAVLGILTWGRAALYADEPSLWQDNLARNPAASAAWDNLGLARNRAGRYDDAVQCFDRALALSSSRSKVYNNRALAYAGMGRYDLAINDYDRAVAEDPRLDRAWNNRALARIALRQYDLAVRDCSQAILLKPDYMEAYYTRATAWQGAGRSAEAIQDYDKVIALKPDFAEAYNNRAVAYYRLKAYDKAWADVKIFVHLGGQPNPEFIKALNQAAGYVK